MSSGHFRTSASSGRAVHRIGPKGLGRFLLSVVAFAYLVPLCAQAQVQRTFINMSFEQPALAPQNCWRTTSSSQVPGWQTTHPSNANGGTCTSPSVVAGPSIELWRSLGSVGPRDGLNHAELNAYEASRIYQTVCLVNGESIGWRFAHRGRSGTDVMDFNIGANASGSGATRIVRATTSNTGAGSASLCVAGGTCARSGAISGVTGGWRDYSGRFVWSGGSGARTIGFQAISSANGRPGFGNLIDAIQVTLMPFVEFTRSTYTTVEGVKTGQPAIRVVGTVPAGGIKVAVAYMRPGEPVLANVSLVVTVPAGTYDLKEFTVFPDTLSIDDSEIEDNGQLELSLQSGSGYHVASTSSCGGTPISSATWTVVDNDIDLAVAMEADRAVVPRGEPFRYTTTFVNNTARPVVGTLTAHDATAAVSNPVPAGVAFDSWTCQASGGARCPGGTTDGATTGSGAIAGSAYLPAGDAAAGGKVVYTITARLENTPTCAAVVNTASIATPSGRQEGNTVGSNASLLSGATFVTPAPGGTANNSAQVQVRPACADVGIVKSATPTEVRTGEEVVYTLVAANNGPDAADGAVVTDPGVPDSLECTKLACVPANGATCPASPTPAHLASGLTIPTLPKGGSVTLSLTCTVTATGD